MAGAPPTGAAFFRRPGVADRGSDGPGVEWRVRRAAPRKEVPIAAPCEDAGGQWGVARLHAVA
ncbi:MAG: hypothetical protein AMXMBFR55_29110 [Gemmatimonadota bacterium]